jgi:hypothetical protein
MLLDSALPAALDGAGGDAAPEPPRPCKPPSLHTELPKLVTVQQWFSAKAVPREAITIITQLSADRCVDIWGAAESPQPPQRPPPPRLSVIL